MSLAFEFGPCESRHHKQLYTPHVTLTLSSSQLDESNTTPVIHYVLVKESYGHVNNQKAS